MSDSPTAPGCAFCAIVAGTAPAYRILEDEHCLAFLDIAPFSTGHTLVVPKAHARTLLDMAEPDAGRVLATASRVARRIAEVLAPEGFTLLQTNEAAGWQTVFHVHLHVIPRWREDGILPPALPPRRSDDLPEIARLLAEAP